MTLPTLLRWTFRPRALPWLSGLGRGRDYAVTFATEFATLGCTIIALKLAAVYWGPTGFGEYMLGRRTLALLQLPILCGMAVGVTRYVARARALGDRVAEYRYLAGGLLVSAVTVGATGLLVWIVPGPLATALFGDSQYRPLLQALGVGVAGLAIHGVAYGFFRGRLAMRQANLLQAVNLGLVPLAVLTWPHLSVVQVVSLTGLLWFVISCATVLASLRAVPYTPGEAIRIRAAATELLRYGAPRVPGEFALGALFALPLTIAAHIEGVTAAGFLGLGVSLLTMVGSLFAPLGQIVLPAVSARLLNGDADRLRADARRLTTASLAGAAVLALGIELGAPLVVKVFGPDFARVVPIARILGLAVIPYVAYIVLRNVLDALDTLPLNAKNLAIALAVFLGLMLTAMSIAGIAWALVAALAVLGALSGYDARRRLSRIGRAARAAGV